MECVEITLRLVVVTTAHGVCYGQQLCHLVHVVSHAAVFTHMWRVSREGT